MCIVGGRCLKSETFIKKLFIILAGTGSMVILSIFTVNLMSLISHPSEKDSVCRVATGSEVVLGRCLTSLLVTGGLTLILVASLEQNP